MANISDVYGTISLSGDWTEEMIKNFNMIVDDWRSWHYCVDIFDPLSLESMHSSFIASGRWTFNTPLECIGEWTNDSENPLVLQAYKNLCKSLSLCVDEDGSPTAFINIEFKEEEGGCGVLREGEAEIVYTDGHLCGIITTEENYEYTKENLVDLGFYDTVEEIDWLDDEDEKEE